MSLDGLSIISVSISPSYFFFSSHYAQDSHSNHGKNLQGYFEGLLNLRLFYLGFY